MAQPAPTHFNIVCNACFTRFAVSAKAKSARCPGCTEPWQTGDIALARGAGLSSVRTAGVVHVQPGAHFRGRSVYGASGMYVEGRVEASACSGGAIVHLAPGARWRGDMRAESLVVEDGAIIEGGFFEIRPHTDAA